MLMNLKIALNFLCDSREAKFLGMNSANLNRIIFNFSSLTLDICKIFKNVLF